MLVIFFMLKMNNLMQLWISLDYVFLLEKSRWKIYIHRISTFTRQFWYYSGPFKIWRLLLPKWVRWIMLFNATFNNISVISWLSVLLVEETGVPWEDHRPAASHWQTLSHNVVSSTPHYEWGSN
jgi:hypothetical protein